MSNTQQGGAIGAAAGSVLGGIIDDNTARGAIIGAVIGEWVGAREGLGYLMIHANAQLQVELVFASIFWLSMIGIGLYGVVVVMERVLVPWRHGGV